LLIGSLIAGLLLAEIVLRLFVEQETKRLASYDADLGWTGRPHGDGWYVRRNDDIRSHFAYNGLGFRDEELPGPGSIRLLFLGDSFLEALEVDYEQSFQKRTELSLREHLGRTVDVVSIASQGYSTAQQLLAYGKFGSAVDPGMVVLFFYTGNDFTDNLRREFAHLDETGRLVLPDRTASSFEILRQQFFRWVYESSHLVFFLKNTAENVANVRIADESKKATPASKVERIALTDSLIARLQDWVVRDGRMFSMVIIPSDRELMAGDRESTEHLVGFCDERGIPVINLFPLLSREDYFHYDEHLNERGHGVVADTLASFLMSRHVGELTEKSR